MRAEAKTAGTYKHPEMGRSYDRVRIVTITQMVEGEARLEIPSSLEVLAKAKAAAEIQPRL